METVKNYISYLNGYNLSEGTPAIIDFYATWCGPCRALSPSIEKLAAEFDGKVKVIKIDVDKNEELARAARIMSIPTLMFVDKDGNIERRVGGLPYEALVQKAKELMN